MVQRLVVLSFCAIALGTVPGVLATEAITPPTADLACFAWCIRYPPKNSGDLFPIRPLDGEGAAAATGACNELDAVCARRESDDRPEDSQQADRYSDIAISAVHYLELGVFDVNPPIREGDISRDASRCINVGADAEMSSPKRRDDNCANVEAGADYTDTISVLTIALITLLTLVAITLTWVMHRSYRIWRLRKSGAEAH